jgi:RNAse (barnase) inhibitor barstar
VHRYVIDGSEFSTLEEFAKHFSARVLKDHRWNGNLDAFNDILRGGFGTPEQGFHILWDNSKRSQVALGHSETVRQLERMLGTCHPANREGIAGELAAAKRGEGPTVFDWLVEIIRDHGPGGSQSDDRVTLELR